LESNSISYIFLLDIAPYRVYNMNIGYNKEGEVLVDKKAFQKFVKQFRKEGATYEVERRLTEREDVVSQVRIYY